MSQDLEALEHNQQLDLTNCSEVDISHPQVISRVPFASLTPYIPNLTQPVVGFFGGVNKAALNVQREKGLLCILLPYLNQAEGDYVELYCRGIQVDFHNVTSYEADNGLQIPLYIPYLRLPDGPVEDVFFRVTPKNGNVEETAHFRLKVDTLEPGGRDNIASTPQNDNLPKPIFPAGIFAQGHIPKAPTADTYTPKELMEMDWLGECVEGSLPRYDQLDVRTLGLLEINGLSSLKETTL